MSKAFRSNGPDRDALYDLARFASNDNFRSASAAELLIDDSYFRRPVRPEDLALIDFSHPLDRDSLLDLGGLIGHRLLLNAYECRLHRPPTHADPAHRKSAQAFYAAESIAAARAAQPFLENFLFSALWDEAVDGGPARPAAEAIRQFWDDAVRRQATLAAAVDRSPTRTDDEAFVLIQHAALLPSKQWAIRRARGIGLPIDTDLPVPCDPRLPPALSDAAGRRGLQLEPHRYWQFYLSTALGCTNFLYGACWSPARPHAALAALLVCSLHLHAFRQAFQSSLFGHAAAAPSQLDIDAVCRMVAAILERDAAVYGDGVAAEFSQGFAAAARQWTLFDNDLAQQIDWLGALDRSRQTARRLMARVEQDRQSIRLDTFVETLDMCSTTHVHNEHRLVVVESGQMVFWANVGMRLNLPEGDMILVPRSRLHGSSITTETCVYHQPVIPPDWLAQATAGR